MAISKMEIKWLAAGCLVFQRHTWKSTSFVNRNLRLMSTQSNGSVNLAWYVSGFKKPQKRTVGHLEVESFVLRRAAGTRTYSSTYQEKTESLCAPTLKLKWSYMHHAVNTPLLGMTIGQLIDQAAEKYSDVEAVVDVPQGIRKTFAQIRTEADKLGSGFVSLGLQKGDRIGILSYNSYQWYLTYLAAARMGLISVNINFTFKVPELKFCLNKVGIKALVCAETFRKANFHNHILEISPDIAHATPGNINSTELPSLKCLCVVAKKKYAGAFSYDEIMDMGSTEHFRQLQKMQETVQFDDPCNIQYTSGTTGAPKATILTHHGIVNNVACAMSRSHGAPKVPEDRCCVTVPLFHTYGCNGVVIGGLHTGATCVIPSLVFNASDVMKAVEQEKITHMFGTPTMYVDMLSSLEKEPRDVSSLKNASVAAAPCSKELLDQIIKKLGVRRVNNAYGQTEATFGVMAGFEGDSHDSVTATVGFPMDHLEVKIVDSKGHTVPIETPGELCVRGYTTMLGYWGEPEKTRETIQEDRWLRTGDLFVLQENGYGRVVGRVKEMIIRGGENVFPKEIEDYLIAHPKILDVNIVGVPDARLGEELCAFIRLNDGQRLTEEDLRSFCKDKIAYYKIPRYVLFVSEFPKTASGKIMKKDLVKKAVELLNLSSKV